MEFKELTDQQWQFIKQYIPLPPKRGRPPIGARRVLNGILYVLVTGCRWSEMPRRYCHPTTAWRRLKRYQQLGVWQKVLKGLLDAGYKIGKVKVDLVGVDSTTIKSQKGAK